MARLLLLEDDLFLLRALEKLLTAHGYECRTAETAEEAWRHLATETFDLIVLDVMLPRQDGFTFCRRIRSLYYMPILFLTARDELLDTVTGLEVGGDDYLTKPFDPRELVARIRARLRRSEEYAPQQHKPNQIRIGELIVDVDRRNAFRSGRGLSLTEQEFKVLYLLARHREKVMSNQWIFENIWGSDTKIDSKILTIYIRRLRLKIEPDPDHPEIIVTLRGFGYKLTDGNIGSMGADATTSGKYPQR